MRVRGSAGCDRWGDRDLASGTRCLAETGSKLKSSKAVVVIWSKTSVDSHRVADEAGVGRDERRLAALSFEGSMPPLGFRQFQVTDSAGGKGGIDDAPFRNLLIAARPRRALTARSMDVAASVQSKAAFPAVRDDRGAWLDVIGDEVPR